VEGAHPEASLTIHAAVIAAVFDEVFLEIQQPPAFARIGVEAHDAALHTQEQVTVLAYHDEGHPMVKDPLSYEFAFGPLVFIEALVLDVHPEAAFTGRMPAGPFAEEALGGI
jgi:hypothetical protein